MAITYVNYSDTYNASSSTNVVAIPTSTASGDLMILAVNVNVTGTSITTDATYTWTLIANVSTNSGSQIATYYRIATSSEPSTYTTTFGSTQRNRCNIFTFSGTNGASPINTSNAAGDTSSVTSHSVTTITPSVDNCLICYFTLNDDVNSGYTFTEPTGFTEIVEVSTNGDNFQFASLQQTTATATGTVTSTSSTSVQAGMHLIAIAPSTGVEVKTVNGLALTSVKVIDDLAIASVKTIISKTII